MNVILSPTELEAANIALVRRLFDEIVNCNNVPVAEALMSPNLLDHNPGASDLPGRDGIIEVFQMLRQAFPDMHGHIDDIFAEGENVVLRWTVQGTNTRVSMGVQPTGRNISGTGIDVLRVQEGCVTERWGNSDDQGLLLQLGIILPRHGGFITSCAAEGECSAQ